MFQFNITPYKYESKKSHIELVLKFLNTHIELSQTHAFYFVEETKRTTSEKSQGLRASPHFIFHFYKARDKGTLDCSSFMFSSSVRHSKAAIYVPRDSHQALLNGDLNPKDCAAYASVKSDLATRTMLELPLPTLIKDASKDALSVGQDQKATEISKAEYLALLNQLFNPILDNPKSLVSVQMLKLIQDRLALVQKKTLLLVSDVEEAQSLAVHSEECSLPSSEGSGELTDGSDCSDNSVGVPIGASFESGERSLNVGPNHRPLHTFFSLPSAKVLPQGVVSIQSGPA